MKLYVRHMVSPRCIYFVQEAARDLRIELNNCSLGIIETRHIVDAGTLRRLNARLQIVGLEIIEDRKAILTEQIKHLVLGLIHSSDDDAPAFNYSHYLSSALRMNYTYLSNLFSRVEGMTIQQFILKQKIEKVKHLLCAEGLGLKEIAEKMHYSSIGHLSNQFKKLVGLSPSDFRKEMRRQFMMPAEFSQAEAMAS